MNEVQFPEEENIKRYTPEKKGPSKITRLIMKTGLAKNETQAQYTLLIITVVVVVAVILFIF